jgi:hypothetical protein
MSILQIDLLTEDFYKTISFANSEVPDAEDLKAVFAGEGVMVNNTFNEPIVFTVKSFLSNMETQVAEGTLTQFMQREINGKTQVFGKAAQRTSVYEYTFTDSTTEKLPRGVNFIQYAQVNGTWKIISMVWNDENENNIIPVEYLRS